MGGFLRLARPLNCVMSAVGVAIAGIVAVRSDGLGGVAFPLLLACISAGIFTAAGNALNDLYDRETDKVNHPERPLAAGTLTVPQVKGFAAAAFGLAAVLSAFVNPYALGVLIVNILLMVAYEADLKARGAPGNFVIAYLVASLFLFGGVSVFQSSTTPLVRAGVLASLAFFATVGREITKDIEDMAGDIDRRTLPHRIGARRAGTAAAIALVIGVALSLVPLVLGVLSIGYAVLAIPADGMFIYAALHSAANPSRSQRVTKYAMIVALAAFLAGAFT
jgi:geranylgeranylglycerol-phosphate geranylgeranyltransferase